MLLDVLAFVDRRALWASWVVPRPFFGIHFYLTLLSTVGAYMYIYVAAVAATARLQCPAGSAYIYMYIYM